MSQPLKHPNRRSAFLCGGGVGYILLGISYLTQLNLSRSFAFEWSPVLTPEIMGVILIAAGAISVIMGALAPLGHNLSRWGFMSLMAATMLLSTSFWIAWGLGDHPSGWAGGVLYLLMTYWVFIVSGWENPHQIPPVGGRDD